MDVTQVIIVSLVKRLGCISNPELMLPLGRISSWAVHSLLEMFRALVTG